MRNNEIIFISLNGYIGLNVSNQYKKIDMNASETFASEEIKNKYDNSPYRIPLRNKSGVIVEFALVEEQDFERVNARKWHLSKNGYAQG
jgi:histidinol phosphatase-like enzyme